MDPQRRQEGLVESETNGVVDSSEVNPREVRDDDDEAAADSTGAISTNDSDTSSSADLLPDYLRGPLDPARMRLSPQERQWAVEIKDAVQSLPDLDDLSDFMCAQFALIDQGNMANAIQRAYNMQACRQEYEILDTFNQGQRVLSRFLLEQVPTYILNFFYCKAQDRYVLAVDFTKMNPKAFSRHEDRNTVALVSYYFYHAIHMDLMSIRKGLIFSIEWEGFVARAPEMIDIKFLRRMNEGVTGCYPHHFYEIQHFNTGLFVNMLLSMGRRFTPKSVQDKFILGCKSDTRLDNLCLVPNREVALARIERELVEALRRRFEADKAFRL